MRLNVLASLKVLVAGLTSDRENEHCKMQRIPMQGKVLPVLPLVLWVGGTVCLEFQDVGKTHSAF